jgi:curved DNA-binding protein CbpA
MSSQQQDPYDVLRLPRNFTLEQLKTNYKRMALQLHPDKNLVSTEAAAEIFKLLTHSYKTLLNEYHLRQSDRQYGELKQGFRDSNSSSRFPQEQDPTRLPTRRFQSSNGRFDVSQFNTFFSENRQADPVNEKGYSDFMKSSEVQQLGRVQKSLPSECRSLMLHVDAMPLTRSRLAFSEMGQDSLDDFSLVDSVRRVNAMDLRAAYSKMAAEDGPEAGPARREYRNVLELQTERSGLALDPTPEGHQAMESYKEYLEALERKQQSRIKKMDTVAEQHYQRLQNLLTS